ncbi:PhoH family protein [Candidatus Venteria ishoeyi]|uniref:PhoH-like protein n=1 Tax=Candidatus Venteria ishoeyi TaxID=1899563 RepID=A0A1H6FJB5_9GAMM|nr:PhoH family protein [Candidatus Venteria ishoeyi]MDM8546755.1 PhoH family protein [Candidatus Venteria ishoeyi]SEH09125.1 PhoH-like protein [Candidatus Venteria ishoeyi]SEH09254.1 PhoH-like protein [Candidatus Venteria ishoeyi]
MTIEKKEQKCRLFVLDTNVLMHDPTAIFRFQEHDVYLPMVVLEELDAGKKGTSEVARNVRQVTRFLADLIHNHAGKPIDQGLPLSTFGSFDENDEIQDPVDTPHNGQLFFQTQILEDVLPDNLPGKKPDNNILNVALRLGELYPDKNITLVSKDINLRVKAYALGIYSEDYYNDKVLDDVNLLYSGTHGLEENFWKRHTEDSSLTSWQEGEFSFYKLKEDALAQAYPNQCIYSEGDQPFDGIIKNRDDEDVVTIQVARDYHSHHHSVWGITARNREQNFALNLLMDPEVDFVTLLGVAGTGKTLMALAAGLVQTLDAQLYREIIVTRVTVPVGEDIGFLPGTEEEKMTPWMGALMDNLEVLNPSGMNESGDWGRSATSDLINTRIKIRSLNFMRGRTFLNRYLIIDEAQNLTPKQVKTLITRAGPGTKIVCLGNIAQIDTPYLSETTSGLTYVVDRFKQWSHSGHITLKRGERSRLADFATEVL